MIYLKIQSIVFYNLYEVYLFLPLIYEHWRNSIFGSLFLFSRLELEVFCAQSKVPDTLSMDISFKEYAISEIKNYKISKFPMMATYNAMDTCWIHEFAWWERPLVILEWWVKNANNVDVRLEGLTNMHLLNLKENS